MCMRASIMRACACAHVSMCLWFFAVRVRVCAYTDTRVCVHVCVNVCDRERICVFVRVSQCVCVHLDAQPVTECAASLLEKFNTQRHTYTPKNTNTNTNTYHVMIGMISKNNIDPIMFNMGHSTQHLSAGNSTHTETHIHPQSHTTTHARPET
jgi:hypothetical protein